MGAPSDSMASESWSTWLGDALDLLADKHLLRSLRPVALGPPRGVLPSPAHLAVDVEVPPSPVHVKISHSTLREWLADAASTGGAEAVAEESATSWHDVRLFSTNDYLGLSAHPAVARAVVEAAALGMGPRASALVTGYTHQGRGGAQARGLETALAGLKGTEESLVFPSGFAANTAVVSCLCAGVVPGSAPVAIFSDMLNHASIVDGARLAKPSGATLHVYRHNDMDHLEVLLRASPAERKMVVTDSVFSMDGDVAPLQALAELRDRYHFLLVVDEAHATLVHGAHGGGAAEAAGVAAAIDVHVGTLSKAFGSLGGFVCCSARMKQYLLTRGRAFVYSTALPLPVVVAAHAALHAATADPGIRWRLWQRVKQLGHALGRQLESPIVALVVGEETGALEMSRRLLQLGFHVPAIRPPTVPPGTSRLRSSIALSAAHSEQDVRDLVEALQRCGALEAARQYHTRAAAAAPAAADSDNPATSTRSKL